MTSEFTLAPILPRVMIVERRAHRLDTKIFALKVWGKLIPFDHEFRYKGRKTVYLIPSAESIMEYYQREVIKQDLP